MNNSILSDLVVTAELVTSRRMGSRRLSSAEAARHSTSRYCLTKVSSKPDAAVGQTFPVRAQMETPFGEVAVAVTLDALPDDALQQIIAACGDTAEAGVPLFEAVKSLACLSKALLQQLHRLRPPVGVQSLTVVQRPARGPWRVALLYKGELTAAVVEQARQGRVHSIDSPAGQPLRSRSCAARRRAAHSRAACSPPAAALLMLPRRLPPRCSCAACFSPASSHRRSRALLPTTYYLLPNT